MSVSRIVRAQQALRDRGVRALVAGPSADLRYLTGYDAPPLERPTLLVVPADADAFVVVPALERLRAEAAVADAEIVTWEETADPYEIVRGRLRVNDGDTIAAGDRLWAMFLLRLQDAFPGTRFVPASQVTRSLRLRKDHDEIDRLARSASAADLVALALAGEKVSGRSERELSRWISDALLDAGLERVNFAIVAAGENAASPHHQPGERPIGPGDALVCDFGGTLDGYCSDITRTFFVGEPPAEFVRLYDVLRGAQQTAVAAVRPGIAAEAVDAAAREVIAAAGYGDRFVHRTGHGIGLDEHEDPYLVAGNAEPLAEGMAFSVEPGIYIPGSFGARIEDIVVCEALGGRSLNLAPRDLVTLA